MPKLVNVLTCHHINPYKDTLTIPPYLFEKMLHEISKKYSFISYQYFKDFIFEDRKLPAKPVFLTLDDGYLDNFIYAYPVLKKLNIPAVIFAVTGFIRTSDNIRDEIPVFKSHKELEQNPDEKYYINTAEIKEMESSNLIDIESHTTAHFICRNKSYKEIYAELTDSLTFIKTHTRQKKYYGFCWPKGVFDETSIKAIKDSSYSFAFSTVDGAFHKGDDLFAIKRIDCSSWNQNENDYLSRIKRKIFIYSNPMISKFYSNFREYRIKKRRE